MQTIFDKALPKTVDLPFATVEFVREPNKADVQTLAELPNVVLSMVEQRTAVVHQFYLRVKRKPVNQDTVDMHRAEDLLQEEVMTAIRQFAHENMSDGSDFEPHYPMMAYELTAPRSGTLRPDAHRQYFLELIGLAVPHNAMGRDPHGTAFSLNKNDHGTRFNLHLAPGLEMTVSTQEADVWAHRQQNDPQYITGTAKLLGKKAYLLIGPNFHTYHPHRVIRNWLTDEVLHDEVQQALQNTLGEAFGSIADDVINELLDGLAFNLA